MSLMDPILDRVADLRASISGQVVLRWGTVTGLDPFRVRLDADTDPLPFKPDRTVSGLTVGDRVYATVQNRRVTVIGRGGGAPALPAPKLVNRNGADGNVGGTGGTFELHPTLGAITIDAPRPMYARVDFGASVYAYSGYIMLAVATIGELECNVFHTLGTPLMGPALYGMHTPYWQNTQSQPQNSITGVKIVELPEGETTFRLYRMRSATGIVAVSAYTTMSVTPIGWA